MGHKELRLFSLRDSENDLFTNVWASRVSFLHFVAKMRKVVGIKIFKYGSQAI